MKPLSEETKLVRQFAESLWECRTEDELNDALDLTAIKKALNAFSEHPSELVLLYALNLERIRRNLDYLPEYLASVQVVGKAATILGSIYLQKIGFISDYAEQPDGMTWTLDPVHRTFETIEELKHKNGFLFRLARLVMARNAGLDPIRIRFGQS